MPYPTMTLPTYADTIPGIHEWAIARDLLHPDGTAHLATTWGQHAKTMEEIGEAQEALLDWIGAKRAFASGPLQATNGICFEVDIASARESLALEFGDILVTLVLQAALQGVPWDECLSASGRLGTGYGINWHLGVDCGRPFTWDYVDHWANMLGQGVELGSMRIPEFIGAVARCAEDAIRIELSLTGPECLALALAKIRDRRGEMVDGVFVREKG